MPEIKSVYPYNGNEKLVCHYAENESGERFCIEQVETGIIYSEAVDVYPCRYTYRATDIRVDSAEPTNQEV